ncbi:hypothetical protein GCM10027343_22230 [Noviherbaspirillum agri]
MTQDVETYSRLDEVVCACTECRQRFRAVPLIPTLSGSERLGRLRCPHCGRMMTMDARLLWLGLAH